MVYSERIFDGKVCPFNDDNTIDCGTSYDLMDPASWADNNNIKFTESQINNRKFIRNIMESCGFKVLPEEWWHFSPENETFPDTYFDFDINYQLLDSYADVVYYKEQLERLKLSVKKLEKSINDEIASKSLASTDEFIKIKEEINGVNVIIVTTKNYDVPILKQMVDSITNELANSFVLLANIANGSVNIIAKTNIVNDKLNCGTIVKDICLKCSGNGGGNKQFAQGGGSDAKDIGTYLKELKNTLKEM